MNTKLIRSVGAACLLAIWLTLTGFAWFSEAKQMSVSERRPLAQMPAFSMQALLDGSYMEKFEQGSLDQFPLRDGFRTLKAMFHYYALNQSDNNGVYLSQGHAAKLLYPLDEEALTLAMERLNRVYERYLKDTDSRIYVSVIPDKSYWLSELAMDYEATVCFPDRCADCGRLLQDGYPLAAGEPASHSTEACSGHECACSRGGGFYRSFFGQTLLRCLSRAGGLAHAGRTHGASEQPCHGRLHGLRP